MKNINAVTIRRLNSVFLPKRGEVPSSIVTAFVSNSLRLGYFFTKEALSALFTSSVADLESVLDALRESRGAQFTYTPMYPNFPRQVAEASDVDLYANAINHYFGAALGFDVMPEYDKEVRQVLSEFNEAIVLDLVDEKGLEDVFAKISRSAQPFSAQDVSDVVALSDYALVVKPMVRENLATLAGLFKSLDYRAYFTHVTDVLRYATSLAGGDVSLTKSTRFAYPRWQRRVILGLLEDVLARGKEQDFYTHAEKWKRLAYALRAGDYKNRYPKSFHALSLVQEGLASRGFNSRVEAALKSNVRDSIDVLSQYPGVFARRLAELLRKYPEDRALILSSFEKIAGKVSLTVLTQMINLFISKDASIIPKRQVFLKSARGDMKTVLIDNRVTGDNRDVVRAILAGFNDRYDAGRKMYFTRDPYHYAVPLNHRSTSSGSQNIARGSKTVMSDNKNTLRLFTYWKGIVDLDLSVTFISDDFSRASSVWYANLRTDGVYHSGDVVRAPQGASEFIDVNIDALKSQGYRYIVPRIHVFSDIPFSEIDESITGFMMREDVNSGEVYEPTTVQHVTSLDNNTKYNIPFVFDAETREAIWWDSTVKLNYSSVNVNNNTSANLAALQDIIFNQRVSVGMIARLLGRVVESEDEATLIIDPSQLEQVSELLNL